MDGLVEKSKMPMWAYNALCRDEEVRANFSKNEPIASYSSKSVTRETSEQEKLAQRRSTS